MKQFMIDTMSMMMPYMKPIVYLGAAAVIAAVLLGITRTASGAQALAAKIAIAVGLFFIACELAGRMLGMEPTLLFASNPFDRALYRNQWPFWSVGLLLFVVGLMARKMYASPGKDT